MPKIHTPLPQELAEEFVKAASILDHFIKGTTQLDQTLIPGKVIANAKGVAVITIVKAGFIWSGRGGAGLVVAKLPNGQWSAPSAIAAGGAGFGAQIGAEVTDTVFILNTEGAVKAFSQGGNVTFGANLSIAAGPVGRSAEGAGAVAQLAAIYAYSKTKGLFAGVSLEGLVILTRKETNARFYGSSVTPADLLSGKVSAPPQADVLYRALNYRGFGSSESLRLDASQAANPTVPPHPGKPRMNVSSTATRPATTSMTSNESLPQKAITPVKQNYDVPPALPSKPAALHSNTAKVQAPAWKQSSDSPIPTRPVKPHFEKAQLVQPGSIVSERPPPVYQSQHPMRMKRVTAVYDFAGERPGDLAFRAGDSILVHKSEEGSGWWEGEVNGTRGVFPANYVQ